MADKVIYLQNKYNKLCQSIESEFRFKTQPEEEFEIAESKRKNLKKENYFESSNDKVHVDVYSNKKNDRLSNKNFVYESEYISEKQNKDLRTKELLEKESFSKRPFATTETKENPFIKKNFENQEYITPTKTLEFIQRNKIKSMYENQQNSSHSKNFLDKFKHVLKNIFNFLKNSFIRW